MDDGQTTTRGKDEPAISEPGGAVAAVPRWISRHLPSSVSGRLILLMLVVLVPVLLLQVGFYVVRFEERRADELQSDLEVARAVSGTFDAYFRDILRQELAIGIAFTSPQPLPADQEKRFLNESVRDYPSVRYFSWVNAQGLTVVSSQADHAGLDVSQSAYFQEIAQGKESAISDLFQDAGQQAAFAVCRGVRDGSGSLQGIAVAVVDPQRLGSLLAIQRTEQGGVDIIDPQGFMVYRYPEVATTWQDRNWLKTQPIIGQALAGHEVATTAVWPVDQRTRMVGLAPVRSIGWVASASRPESTVMASLIQSLLRDTGLLVFVAVSALLVALAIARSFTNPVRRLQQHALALGRGDVARRVDPTGLTELDDLASAFNQMAGEVSVRQEALSQLAAIVESSNDAIISKTLDGTIVSWNPGAERLCGYTAEEVKGKSIALLIPPEPADELPWILERIRRGERLEHYETAWIKKDGTQVDVSLTISPIKDASGRTIAASTIARDVTEREREMERLRSDLLSTVSHELRTPLTLIRTCIGLLVDSDPDATMRERLLRNIKQSADRMHALVADVLDLVRLRSGRMEMQMHYVDVGELVEGAAALMRPLVDEKEQTLAVELPPAPVTVMADNRRLEQALLNLLSNANKFSLSGAAIRIAVAEEGEMVTISVSDTGPAIPPEAQAHLFEQFYTSRTSSPSHNIGAGLGLPIAKSIVEAHGGRIWVESDVEAGNTFYISVPKEGPGT